VRPVGTEREVALGSRLNEPSAVAVDARSLYESLERALLRQHKSCPALYYKGGRFLDDGSLLHFEISQLEDPRQGLLEWASPECRGGREAALYVQAQEVALLAARQAAAEELTREAATRGVEPILLGNTCDRFGNAYGAHESYEVEDRARGWRAWLGTCLLHPLVLGLLGLGFLLYLIPLLGLLIVGLLIYGAIAIPAQIPTLGAPFLAGTRALEGFGRYLVEGGPGPFQGIVARALVTLARGGGLLFSWSARLTLFSGQLPDLLPFLVTRPVIAGAGHLGPEGRFVLTPRAEITTSVVSAFVIGTRRPLIDVKALFFRSPWRYLERRQRLHVVASDATRCPTATWLRLSLTELVLDASQDDALGGLRAALALPEGPLGAFRRAASPDLGVPVGRFAGEPVTALGVQRLYLEALEAYAQRREEAQRPLNEAQGEALAAWRGLLADLEEGGPGAVVDRCDWARKLALLEGALGARWPTRSAAEAWAELARWGPLNALVEERAPEWREGSQAELEAAMGRRRRRLRELLGELGTWEEWLEVRETWLTLKSLDLAYHELSPESPYATEPRAREVFSPTELHEARHRAPETRARIRAAALSLIPDEGLAGVTLELGWERLRVTKGEEVPLDLDLRDVEQTELSPGDLEALQAALRAETDSG
jgi:pup-ligase protein